MKLSKKSFKEYILKRQYILPTGLTVFSMSALILTFYFVINKDVLLSIICVIIATAPIIYMIGMVLLYLIISKTEEKKSQNIKKENKI